MSYILTCKDAGNDTDKAKPKYLGTDANIEIKVRRNHIYFYTEVNKKSAMDLNIKLKEVERDIIEIAPLAYMRGRTLREAFIIMDEGQNTTIEQMKMFLTRLGFGSKAVVNGDLSQIDLPKSSVSGLKHAIEVLKDVESIKFTKFTARDVVRHSLVQEIVEAYDNFE